MEENIKTHIAVVAWLNIISNIAAVIFGGLFLMGGPILGALTGDGGAFAFISGFAALLGVPFLLYGLLGVMAGVGLLQRAPWARVLGIIVAILHLANVTSFGLTLIIGIYSLIVLFNPATERYLR